MTASRRDVSAGAASAARLIAVLVAQVLVIVALHRLGRVTYLQVGWPDLAGWVERTAAEDVLLACSRAAALAAAYWMAGSTVLYALARASRVPAAVRAVRWAALPPVRRLADRVIAVTLTGSTVLSGGVTAAHESPSTPVAAATAGVEDARPSRFPVPLPPTLLDPLSPTPGTGHRPQERSERTDRRSDLPVPPPPPPVAAAAAPSAPAVPAIHVVQPGEHLWGIAAATLEQARGRPVGEEEVAQYWRRVVALNRDRLGSSDPDLVQHGETVQLPAPLS